MNQEARKSGKKSAADGLAAAWIIRRSMLDVGCWAFSAPEYHRSSFLLRTFLTAFLLKLTAPELCASAFR
jgi:hypothetical protein